MRPVLLTTFRRRSPIYVPPALGSAWNPSDKDADVSLSAGNLTASLANTFQGAVRGTLFNSSGLHYFQVTVDAGGDHIIGLGNASATLTNSYPGANTNSWGYYQTTGQKYTNGVNSNYGETYTTGDVIGCLYNATAGTISFYKNGRFQGIAFSGVSGSLYPMWGSGTATGTRTVTLNTTLSTYGAVYGYWNPDDKDADIVLSNSLNTGTWTAGSGGFNAQRGVIGKSSGKSYIELTMTYPGSVMVGLGNASALLTNYPGQNVNSWGYGSDGLKYTNGSSSAYGATYASTNVIGMDYDASSGTLVFYKNGVSQGTAFTGLSGTLYPMWANTSSTAGNYVSVINHGGSAFTGSLPGGSSAWGQLTLPTGASAWG